MLYAIFEFGKTLAIGVLLNDYARRIYPSKYREIGIEIVFNVIHTLSCCQVACKNGIQYMRERNPEIMNYIEELFKRNPKQKDIEFVKDNNVIYANSKNYFLHSTDVFEIPECDFLLYTDVTTNYIKIIGPVDEKMDLTNSEIYKYDVSNKKFIMVELIVSDKVYKIELASKTYNFYVKGNILDKKFFLYFLRNIHPEKVVTCDEQMNHITIKVIDDNVDIKHYDLDTEHIVINE